MNKAKLTWLAMRAALTAAIIMFSAPSSFAQITITWQNIGTDWGTAANWNPNTIPNDLVNHIAAFGPQATPMQPNIAASFSVRGMTFDNALAAWNLTSSSASNFMNVGQNGITWTGGAASTLSANMYIAADQTWDVGSTNVSMGGAANAGALFGFNALTKTGSGTLIMDSAGGLFTGGFTISNGTLQAGSATNNAAGQVLRSNSVSLAPGTSLTTLGTPNALSVGNLSGNGSVTPATGGAINIVALNDSNFLGTVTTTGGLNLRGANGTSQEFSGNLTGLTGTVGINSGATMLLSGTGDSTSGVLGSAALAIRGGTLWLYNTPGNTLAASGRINDAATTTFNGGAFNLIGNISGTTETIGAITLNTGAGTINVVHNGGAGGTVLTITDGGGLRDSTSMTMNFAGIGGTLGAAGANPRIVFTSAVTTGNGGLIGNSANTIGWATVDGSEWAGVSGGTTVVALAPTLTASTNVTLQTSTTASVTLFNPTANQTLTGAVAAAALKIDPAAGLSLDLGTNHINTGAVMLAGFNDYSITGTTGALFGTLAATRYVHVVSPDTTLNVAVSLAGANQPFNKAGSGFLNLNGSANQLGFTNAQSINILDGVLRGTATSLGGFTSAGGAFTNINLYGGTLELSGGGTFVRSLDLTSAAGGGTIRIDQSATTRGDPGFSAINGDMSVTFVTTVGGAIPSNLVWNDGAFVPDGHVLKFGSSQYDSRIELTNNIGLDTGAATNPYSAREIRVANNSNSNTDMARLSGVITGSFNADLLKTGAGTLELTNNNTYAGNTIIQQGVLLANNATSSTGTGNVIVGASGKLGGTGTIAPSSGNKVLVQGGILAPGASAGTLTINSNVTLQDSSTYEWEINNAAPATALANTGGSDSPGLQDLLAITGAGNTLTAGDFTLVLSELTVPTFTVGQTYSWTVASTQGTPTIGTVTLDLNSAPTFDLFGGAAQMSLAISGNNIYLNFTPVPEPAAVLGICAAAGWVAGVVVRRRNRKNQAN